MQGLDISGPCVCVTAFGPDRQATEAIVGVSGELSCTVVAPSSSVLSSRATTESLTASLTLERSSSYAGVDAVTDTGSPLANPALEDSPAEDGTPALRVDTDMPSAVLAQFDLLFVPPALVVGFEPTTVVLSPLVTVQAVLSGYESLAQVRAAVVLFVPMY